MIFINITLLKEDYIQEIVKLWNENLDIPYHVTEKMVNQKIFDDRDTLFEGSFMLLDDSGLAGFIVSKINRGKLPGYDHCAWISVLVVGKKYQNKGFGKELYSKAEAALYQSGVEKIIIGGELDNFFSGIPQPAMQSICFFAKRGFTLNNDEHYDLWADVSVLDLDAFNVDMNKSEDFCTNEMIREDKGSLGKFFDRTFPGRWKMEVFNYLEQGGDLKNVLILWHKEKIVGFCKIFISEEASDLDFARGKNWGSLGPIGISEDVRGKGLGNRILYDSLKFLQSRGAKNVIIDWTVLKNFYGQFGFMPLRTYRGAYKMKNE